MSFIIVCLRKVKVLILTPAQVADFGWADEVKDQKREYVGNNENPR